MQLHVLLLAFFELLCLQGLEETCGITLEKLLFYIDSMCHISIDKQMMIESDSDA